MTLIIVDKREQPINIYYDGLVSSGDYVHLRHCKKVQELTHFWYGLSGHTNYDLLFEFLDAYLTKKKVNITGLTTKKVGITRLLLYEGIIAAQKILDFDWKDESNNAKYCLDGFLISKENQDHFDITMENHRIIDLLINREPYNAYGMRMESLHLLDAGVSIEKTYEICSKRCYGVGGEYKTITLPIKEII